ncbi:tail fiber domain-containing protein [Nocardioides sp. R1-1]|uniref:tail fiber domain-containing protein n=1 Tax=Nocardioides sp. R1-1 TaxID=3383502 RepID=UPI0038D0A3C6
MATPQGAKQQDLVQQIRDLEQQVRALTAASLRRQQLSVTEGDFVVSGGGSVILRDGGSVWVSFPEDIAGDVDNLSTYLGDMYASGTLDYFGTGALVMDHEGAPILVARTGADGLRASGLFEASGGTAKVHGITGLFLTAGPTGQVQIGLGGNAGVFIGHGTTSSAANARLEDNGLLSRVTSSLRYKAEVEDAEVDPAAVLQLRGRTWVDRRDEGDPDAKRHVGFIAEELHAAGLSEFVEYDDQGRPDAIQYDRMSVALLAVVKSQQAQLDAIAARLDALEATP